MQTTLTKLQQKLYAFTSKSNIRPELNSVLFDGVKAVATDSFRLVETTKLTTTGKAIPTTLITRDSLQAIKLSKADTAIDVDTINGQTLATPNSKKAGTYGLTMLNAEGYPKYQTLKDEAEKREYIEITINGEYLAEIAGYLAKFQDNAMIKMRIPSSASEKHAPIILEAQTKEEHGYAMLMPIRR